MARIIINPQVFKDSRDAMCVAFDEAFRILMEYMDFECVSEPTDEQRRFFADTAYADDEVQLRRTILARICTLDTSIKDPTDEQLQEAVEFLDAVMESGAPQNEWEQRSVQRLRDVVASIPPAGKAPPASGVDVEPEEDPGVQVQAAIGGGETDDDEKMAREQAAEPGNEPTEPGEEPAQTDELTIHIGASVRISDSGGAGGNRRQNREPRKGSVEDGLHADNPANRLEGGTHTRDGMSGSIGAGLHADNPANRLEGGTHTRDGMAGAINKPITTSAEMGPKVSEEGRIDKPIKKDKTRI